MINLPGKSDYIDIHNHDCTVQISGIFTVESILAHEEINPGNIPGLLFSVGIHPWYLGEENHNKLIDKVKSLADNPYVIAIGEAGFDKIRGPSADLQRKTFEEQVYIAEEHKKPVIIHCVRAWDELMAVNKKIKPAMPWLVHGFRGKSELALQLISKGMYISFWFDFAMRPESARLIRSLPKERFFLETDGSGVDIRDIYKKVSADLEMTIGELKNIIHNNFNDFINPE
jgi:TatD DNase family protein